MPKITVIDGKIVHIPNIKRGYKTETSVFNRDSKLVSVTGYEFCIPGLDCKLIAFKSKAGWNTAALKSGLMLSVFASGTLQDAMDFAFEKCYRAGFEFVCRQDDIHANSRETFKEN